MMKYTSLPCLLLLTLFGASLQAAEVPLDLDRPNWQTLEYKGIPANTVLQASDGIQIQINASASPLIYVFDQPEALSSIQVRGGITGGLPAIPDESQQGDEGADDFAFRIGLVIAGDKTLSFAQKLIAADWVTTLYDLAPSGDGIEHVRFLNLANPGKTNIVQRAHPLSKGLFFETIVGEIQANQNFELDYSLDETTPVLALWISSDGDDTASSYTIKLNNISYQ